MNAFVLRNLRRQYEAAKEAQPENGEEEETESSLQLPDNKYTVLNININKFEKPVGAVILSDGKNDIKDIIDIRKE